MIADTEKVLTAKMFQPPILMHRKGYGIGMVVTMTLGGKACMLQ